MSRANNKELYVPKGPPKKSELEIFIEKHRLPPLEDMARTLLRAIAVSLGVIALCLLFGFRLVKSTNDDGIKYRYCGFMWFGEPTLGRLNSSDGVKATVFFRRVRYSDGSLYAGKLEELQKKGQGTLVFEDGGKYVGTFSNGKFDGYGEHKWADGASYSGEYRAGLYHGSGTLRLSDGSVYTGSFENGEKHGSGKMTYSNGDVFEGEFENDMRKNGIYTWVSGESIEGTFENNLPSAKEKIIYTDSSGDKYKAFYKDGSLFQKSVYIPPKEEEKTEPDKDDSDTPSPAG